MLSNMSLGVSQSIFSPGCTFIETYHGKEEIKLPSTFNHRDGTACVYEKRLSSNQGHQSLG
jgi:hypothetical protein